MNMMFLRMCLLGLPQAKREHAIRIVRSDTVVAGFTGSVRLLKIIEVIQQFLLFPLAEKFDHLFPTALRHPASAAPVVGAKAVGAKAKVICGVRRGPGQHNKGAVLRYCSWRY